MLLVANSELGRMLVVDVVVLSIVVVTAKKFTELSPDWNIPVPNEDHGENLLHKIEDDACNEGGSHFIAGEKLSDRSACKHPEQVG